MGVLGDNTTSNRLTPVRVLGGQQGGTYLENVENVAFYAMHICAVIDNGSVYCWGYNGQGKLGDNTETTSYTPVRVKGGQQGGTYLSNIKDVGLEYGSSCAITNDGEIYCWGYNGEHNLGDNTTIHRHTPVRVLGGQQGGTYLEDIIQFGGGQHYGCAIQNEGSVYCWGNNYRGQLGDDSTSDRHTPAQVLGGEQGGTYLDLITTPYATSGDFISSSIDLTTETIGVGNLDFNITNPANTEIKFQIAANNDNATWNFIGPDGTDSTYFTSSGTQIPTSLSGNRYFKYKAFLSRTDTSAIVSLDDITINYYQAKFITSSKFNSSTTANSIAGLTWDEDETLPANSEVSIALRTASTEAGLDSEEWSTIGTSTPSTLTTGCTKSGTTITCDSTTIPTAMKTGGDDQWFQYKLSIITGVTAPTVTNINPIYEQDIVAPIITSITSTTANGEYNEGDEVNVTVNFSENTTSATGLSITLDTGGVVTVPAWGTASTSAQGTYTVGAAHSSVDLTVSSITGTITDQSANSLASSVTSIPFTEEGNYVQEDGGMTDIEGGVGKLVGNLTAAGGTITIDGDYTVHTFTESGTFAPNDSMEVEYLVVGGGGGGGNNFINSQIGGGGGGAGEYKAGTWNISESLVAVVGTGGTGGSDGGDIVTTGGEPGYNGTSSSIGVTGGSEGTSLFTCLGGGGGASGGPYSPEGAGKDGGSGGGGGGHPTGGLVGGSAIGNYFGTDGGDAIGASAYGGGGGGGADEEDGGQSADASGGARGGYGLSNDISGTSIDYAGGGGGGAVAGTAGTASFGGGAGGGVGSNGVSAVANTGGGGGSGGGAAQKLGGNGGSGIVVIRYLSGYPTTPSYLTTSDLSQKDTSTWTSMNSLTLTQTTPTNTSIKYLTSFDDRTTWKYWDGDSWEISTLDDFQTNGNSKTELEALSSTNWENTGGFTPGTLDFAMDLSTTDDSVTPELDNIEINYTAADSDYTNTTTDPDHTTSNLATNASLIIDNTAPTSAISVPNGTTAEYSEMGTISGTATDNHTLNNIDITIQNTEATSADYQKYWSGTAWGVTETWLTGTGTGTTAWSYDSSGVVWEVDSEVTIKSRATDQAGNQETPGVGKSFTYVNTSPTVTISSVTKINTDLVVNYAVTDPESSSTTVSLVYDSNATLSSSLDSSETTAIEVSDISNFPTSGTVLIQSGTGDSIRYEYISYTGISGNTLTGITRAVDSTLGYSHDSGVEIKIKAITVSGDSGTVNNGTGKTLTWTPATDNNFYNATQTISIVSNDGASANKIGIDASSEFVFDTVTPVITSTTINATTSPATLTFDVSDDTAIQMMISLNSDFSGASWEAYGSTPTITLVTNPDTVYVKFKDSQENITETREAITPTTPENLMVQDISNDTTSQYRLFLAWSTVAEPIAGFESYDIYHSTDNLTFTLETSITDIDVNYYSDVGLTEDSTHYYKILTKDSSGNQSGYSATLYGTANGVQDGDEPLPPTDPAVITSVTSSDVTSSTATITWDTDEVANSQVEYIITTGGDFSEASTEGKATMLDNASGVGVHTVTLNNLSPNTTYYFQVKSTDSDSETTTSKDGVNGYTFTTIDGEDSIAPVITLVSSGTPNPTSATITWTTDENSNSLVDFGTAQGVYTNTQGNSEDSTTTHSVTLTSLTPTTTYYFQVKSQDSSGNQKTDDNSGTSYSFLTADSPDPGDTTAPMISNVATSDLGANGITIIWDTDEDSDSVVGFSQDETYTMEQGSTTMTSSHSVTLAGLSPSSTYYFQMKSRDINGNLQIETDATTYTFTTSAGGDSISPIISSVSAGTLTSTGAVITWTTDENSNSYVDFGTSTGVYIETQGNGGDSTTSHSVTLTGLTPGGIYYYQVRSQDSNQNQATSGENSFTTSSSPIISGITSSIPTDTSTTISFTTSPIAYGYVDFGTSTGVYTETEGSLTSKTSHSLILEGLTSGETYYYKVRIKDIYGNYIQDDIEYDFTTNEGGSPILSSFSSVTTDGSYNEADTINITATYSETINSGSITIELDTGAEVTLDTIDDTTISGIYTIASNQNSTDLTVSSITLQNICDSDENCITNVTLPATNINTDSDLIVDTTNPVISGFSPITDATVSTDNFSYTLSEAITSGTLTVTRTGGTADGSSPHTYNLSGTDLTEGSHTNIDPSLTLVNGAIYSFSLLVTDPAENTDTETTTTVTYDTDSMTLSSFTSTTSDNIYGPTSTINVTATYSKAIATGELTLTLDTGAEVTLDTISTNTISGTYTIGATGSGEDSADLTVSSIDSESICDAGSNCPSSSLPVTNINTASEIIIDTTALVFTIPSPTNNSTIDNLTTSSDISYSLSEALGSGSILISLISGTDASAPHTCTLTGTDLDSGAHNNFDTTNCTEGMITLTEESIYSFAFSGEDSANNQAISVERTGVTYSLTPTTITISEVNSGTPDSDSTTVVFTTSENSYDYIDYGTTDSYGKVQGNNLALNTSHSITLSGLTAETTYHFRPRIKSISGNYTLGEDQTFATAETAEEASEEGPEISEVTVEADGLGYNSAVISWSTDEESDSLVAYGETVEYGDGRMKPDDSTISHTINLTDLTPETLYYFKVRSMNSAHNLTTNDNSGSGYTFTTLSGSDDNQISEVAQEIESMIENLAYTEEEIMESISNISSIAISSSGPSDKLSDNTDITIDWETNKDSKGKVVYRQEDQDNWTTREEAITETSGYTQDHEVLIKNLNPQTTYEYYVISTSILGNQVTSSTETFTTGETPKISNVMVNSTSLNEAIISWTTNSIKTSILEYGTSTKYGKEKEESSSTSETNQTALLTDLTPGETYHFRIQGIDDDEETMTTNDYTFITAALPKISNVNINDITTEGATITWNTNSKTDSLLEYSFYGEDQGTSQGVLEATTDHSITLEKLIPGVRYQASIFSKDQYGNQAQSDSIFFRTEEDNHPPQIQNISSDTTMYPGEELKIQTVVSWITSKDSYSAIAFRKGAGHSDQAINDKLQEIAKEETSEISKTTFSEWTIIKKPVLTKNHLFILTDFDPASVYQYKVISIDKRENSSISKDYSFLTPSKQESIFDLIIANFEDKFGWMKNMR